MNEQPPHTRTHFDLLIGFAILFLCFTGLNVMGWQWLAYLYDLDMAEISRILEDKDSYAEHKHLLRAIVGITQLATYGFAGLFMMRRIGYEGAALQPNRQLFLGGVLMMFAAIPFIQALIVPVDWLPLSEGWKSWVGARETESNALIETFLRENSFGGVLINLLILALVPAICEEFFFRGFLQTSLQSKYKPLVAILLTAFIFSFLHFQFLGFLSRMFLGAILGYVYYLSGNILTSILAHFAYNSLMVLIGYFYVRAGLPLSDDSQTQFPWYWALASLLLVVFIGRYLGQSRKHQP